ncbi:MAG: hypothetical protein M3Q56_08245 [Bacteroidota bacterium]|nr:hypothetical protein [Bacteroidota bacterium]
MSCSDKDASLSAYADNQTLLKSNKDGSAKSKQSEGEHAFSMTPTITLDICKYYTDSDNSFLVLWDGVAEYITITPDCVGAGNYCTGDPGGGTTAAQSTVDIVLVTGSADPTYDDVNCVLTLPLGNEVYTIKQSTGYCINHGVKLDFTGCTSMPTGSAYIRMQVAPSCPPYISNQLSCGDLDGL